MKILSWNLKETMLNKNNKLYIRALCCESYKTMSDDEGRFIQIKLKYSLNEITIEEPEKDYLIDILPENIINSYIFAGDLNEMKSGLAKTSKIYHIKIWEHKRQK